MKKVLWRLLPVFVFAMIVFGFNATSVFAEETTIENVPTTTIVDEENIEVDNPTVPEETESKEQEESQDPVEQEQTEDETTLTVSADEKNITSTTNVSSNETWSESDINITNNGAVVVESGNTLTINGSTINVNSNQTAFTVKSGATLHLLNAVLDLANVGNHRAIEVVNGGKLIIDGTTIENALGNILDGFINVNGGELEIINNSTIQNNTNTATSSGVTAKDEFNQYNVIRAKNSTVTVKDSTFENNSAGYGGALSLIESETTIDASTFKDNHGAMYGGAIFQQGGNVVIDGNTEFTGNKADTVFSPDGYAKHANWAQGGAIASISRSDSKPSTLTIEKATFDGNEALYQGGAIYVGYYWNDPHPATGSDGSRNNVEIKEALFQNNKVTQASSDISGGAIFVGTGGKLMMSKVAIYDNKANSGGGIASCSDGTNDASPRYGSAIFNNVGKRGDIDGYEDIYIMNVSNGHNLSDRMFNGGHHNWQVEEADSIDTNTAVRAGSNPTSVDISDAKVTFRNNEVFVDENHIVVQRDLHGRSEKIGNGGALGINGTLEIGETTIVNLLINKTWDDKADKNGERPDLLDYVRYVTVKANGTEILGMPTQNFQVDEVEVEGAVKAYRIHGLLDVFADVVASEYEDGSFKISVIGLPMYDDNDNEIDYVIDELPMEGYTLTFSDKYEVEIDELSVNKVKTWGVDFTNKGDDIINISKTTFGGNELPGAQLTVFDSEGNVVETWTSTTETHEIRNLKPGTYTLHEDTAPAGYKVSNDITFTVNEDGTATFVSFNGDEVTGDTVTMVDEDIVVTISKTTFGGDELPGAQLTVFDSNGNIVESWISSTEPHVIRNLPAGTYVLHEDTAPLGYTVANDIVFTVNADGTVTFTDFNGHKVTGDTVVMVDEEEKPKMPEKKEEKKEQPKKEVKKTYGVQTGVETSMASLFLFVISILGMAFVVKMEA